MNCADRSENTGQRDLLRSLNAPTLSPSKVASIFLFIFSMDGGDIHTILYGNDAGREHRCYRTLCAGLYGLKSSSKDFQMEPAREKSCVMCSLPLNWSERICRTKAGGCGFVLGMFDMCMFIFAPKRKNREHGNNNGEESDAASALPTVLQHPSIRRYAALSGWQMSPLNGAFSKVFRSCDVFIPPRTEWSRCIPSFRNQVPISAFIRF